MLIRSLNITVCFCLSFFLNAQVNQKNDCFQALLNDQRFVDVIKETDINFCDSTLILAKDEDYLAEDYFFQNKKLKSTLNANQSCSFLSFSKVDSKRHKVLVKTSDPSISTRVGIGEIILFKFKVKFKKGTCKIKRIKVSKRKYHAKHL